MKWALLVFLLLVPPAFHTVAAPAAQSLADLARKEAERRQKVEQQSIPVKRIESVGPSSQMSGGAISTSSPVSRPASAAGPAPKAEPRPSLRSFQTRLQKLDRDIAQAEDRLKLLRARADAERWAPIKTAKGSKGSTSSSTQDQLRWQILELEGKVAALRKERSDIFQAGRKAGYLPGELEGRGILY